MLLLFTLPVVLRLLFPKSIVPVEEVTLLVVSCPLIVALLSVELPVTDKEEEDSCPLITALFITVSASTTALPVTSSTANSALWDFTFRAVKELSNRELLRKREFPLTSIIPVSVMRNHSVLFVFIMSGKRLLVPNASAPLREFKPVANFCPL